MQLIDSKTALQILDLNHYRYLNYLHKRGLLERFYLGKRTIRYKKDQVENLLSRAVPDGILLMQKPNGVKN